MVSLKKINLLKLEKDNLSDQEMRCLKGGGKCTCGCHYAGYGGSSAANNDAANFGGGYTSYGGGEDSCGCAGSQGAEKSAWWQGNYKY